MASIPVRTQAGYARSTTQRQFVLTKLRAIVLSYIGLDFLATHMMNDPYFMLGPTDLPPPAHLAWLHPLALHAYRALFVLGGIYGALQYIFSANDLLQYYVLSALIPGGRAELWNHTSIFGDFSQVLDRGLAGFWAAWWHQTFRFGFKAPTNWLVRHGWLDPKASSTQVVKLGLAFLGSSILHACGSYTAVPDTKQWRAPLFFSLQFLGIFVQASAVVALGDRLAGLPRWAARTGNALFVVAWLYCTAKPFMDDVSSAGLWLLEPVPVSLFRWLGQGHPSDSWWRWGEDMGGLWYSGKHWWQSGMIS